MQELHDLSGLSVAEKNALILALFERGKASIAQAVRTLAPEPKRVALAVSASPVVHFDEAAERVGTHSSFLRVFTSASAMLICAFLSVGDTRAQVIVPDPGAAPRGLVPAPPAPAIAPAPASGRVVSMEVGASAGHATIEPPGMNSEFGTLTVTQPGDWSATGLLGRSERFGDQSVDFGGSFTKTLPRDVDATVGLSSGTGEFISQRYRFDASLRTPILLSDKSLVATGGFRRMQSKGENFSNGLNAGLAWYVDGHWLLGAGVEADRGYPGDTISKLYLASVTQSAEGRQREVV